MTGLCSQQMTELSPKECLVLAVLVVDLFHMHALQPSMNVQDQRIL